MEIQHADSGIEKANTREFAAIWPRFASLLSVLYKVVGKGHLVAGSICLIGLVIWLHMESWLASDDFNIFLCAASVSSCVSAMKRF